MTRTLSSDLHVPLPDVADDPIHAARAALLETFGYGEFRPGQEAVIGHLLAGRSAAAVFPTGGGKSLCYQIPALLLPGLTLVVSPLIALMKDQIDQLTRRGVAAGRLDSTLTGDEVRTLMDAVRKGSLRLLYVAPRALQQRALPGGDLADPDLALRGRRGALRLRVGAQLRPDYLKLAAFGSSSAPSVPGAHGHRHTAGAR